MSNGEKGEGALPTYEESMSSRPVAAGSKGQQIIDQLTTVRAKHIRSVTEEHIYPRLEEQAMCGIANTIIALIPSDAIKTSASEYDESIETAREGLEVVGFPSGEVVQQVRLQGPLNRIAFWRQVGVVEDLQRNLQERLAIAPFAKALREFVEPRPSTPAQSAPLRRGLLKRGADPATMQAEQSRVDGARSEERNQLQALVKLEELCFRTVSDFGLYGTITRPAVLIRVVAGL